MHMMIICVYAHHKRAVLLAFETAHPRVIIINSACTVGMILSRTHCIAIYIILLFTISVINTDSSYCRAECEVCSARSLRQADCETLLIIFTDTIINDSY